MKVVSTNVSGGFGNKARVRTVQEEKLEPRTLYGIYIHKYCQDLNVLAQSWLGRNVSSLNVYITSFRR